MYFPFRGDICGLPGWLIVSAANHSSAYTNNHSNPLSDWLISRYHFYPVRWLAGYVSLTLTLFEKSIMAVPDPSASCKDKEDTILNYYKMPLPSESPVADPGRGPIGHAPSCKKVIKKMANEGDRIDFMFLGSLPPRTPPPSRRIRYWSHQRKFPLYDYRLNFASVTFDNTFTQIYAYQCPHYQCVQTYTNSSLNKCW